MVGRGGSSSVQFPVGWGWSGGGDSLCGDIIFLLVSGVEVVELLEVVPGGGVFIEGAELLKTEPLKTPTAALSHGANISAGVITDIPF